MSKVPRSSAGTGEKMSHRRTEASSGRYAAAGASEVSMSSPTSVAGVEAVESAADRSRSQAAVPVATSATRRAGGGGGDLAAVEVKEEKEEAEDGRGSGIDGCRRCG